MPFEEVQNKWSQDRHHYLGCVLQVSKAKVWVEQAPWQRVSVHRQPHSHGGSNTILLSHAGALTLKCLIRSGLCF